MISKNVKSEEYVIAENIDLKNNRYNMAVSGVVKDGKEIELISFKIVQRWYAMHIDMNQPITLIYGARF